MQTMIATTPGLSEILFATYYFANGQYSLQKVEEIVAEVKNIKNKDTVTLIASLKHEFQSELLRELFYYYYRALSANTAYLNLTDVQSFGIENDIDYLEGLINLHQKGY